MCGACLRTAAEKIEVDTALLLFVRPAVAGKGVSLALSSKRFCLTILAGSLEFLHRVLKEKPAEMMVMVVNGSPVLPDAVVPGVIGGDGLQEAQDAAFCGPFQKEETNRFGAVYKELLLGSKVFGMCLFSFKRIQQDKAA